MDNSKEIWSPGDLELTRFYCTLIILQHKLIPLYLMLQVGFMQNLYKALDGGKVGIFESPTGTVRLIL